MRPAPPLIISGMGEKSTQLYDMAESFACRLKKYVVTETDDKEAEDETLTPTTSWTKRPAPPP